MNERENRLLPSQTLAYVGDSVIELCVRSLLIEQGRRRPRELNRLALDYVSAVMQAEAMQRILPVLSEDEVGVYRRAHNVGHLHNVPRSATISQYREATGMEALFGYLYLCGALPRIRELFLLGYPQAQGARLPLLTVALEPSTEVGDGETEASGNA